MAQIFYDIAHASLCLEELGGTYLCTARRGDVSTGTVTKLKQALVLKLNIGLGNGVMADDKLLGKSADAGHESAILPNPGLDSVSHVLHPLEGAREAGCGHDSK